MGAETSVLQGCKLEDPLPTPSQKDWTIHPAQRKDGSRVSVFVHKKQEAQSEKEHHLENAARQLKILRHPTILKFFASCENVDGTFLITEQVKPLDLVIDNLTPEEICAGLYNIVEALSFLHERGGASHNNVCMSSIYVSSLDGGWRLGGMEHLCKFEDATVQFLKQSKPLRNAQCIPPEEKKESLTSTAPSYGHARDAYAFGVLAQNLLEYLGDLSEMTDTFEVSIEEFLDPDPTNRPKLTTLMSDKLFKNDFLEITNFVKKLTLKTESEKNLFFEGLASRLHCLPKQLVASRLAPLLLNSFVMAEPMAVSHLFPHLLVPCRDIGSKRHQEFLPDQVNPLIPLELFKRHVIPVLGRVFPSRELHVRNVLLNHFSCYVDLFNEDKLEAVILPQLLIGLKDTSDDIVAASLRALADLVPFLGAGTVVGGERVKYFIEGRPKFPKQQESPLHRAGHVSSLMAVSGVITIPVMDKSSLLPPPPPPLPPTEGSKVMSSKPENSHVAADMNNGNVDPAQKRQERERLKEERERQREEMRLKNEERRREKEQKKALRMGKVTLASLADLHQRDSQSHTSADTSQLHPTTVPPVSSSSLHRETTTSKRLSDSDEMVPESQVSSEDESDDDKADWSDWDDVEHGNQEPYSIQNVDLSMASQSGSKLVPDTVSVRSVDKSRTSGGNKEHSDWSNADDDWNESGADWSVTSQKGPVGKKKTSALQLKSSAKKKDQVKGGSRQSVGKKSNPGNKLEQSAIATSHKSAIPKGQSKTTPKGQSRTTPKGQDRTPPKGHNRTLRDLGEEFDIPDITVVKSSEPDFFADMEPTVSFGGGNVSSSASGAAKDQQSIKPVVKDVTVNKADPISFAVDDTTVMEAADDGWGADDDDFNWDVEGES